MTEPSQLAPDDWPRCLEEGYLMGSEDPVPDLSTYHNSAEDDVVPCSRVFCRSCNFWVRHHDGVELEAGEQGGTIAIQLFDAMAKNAESVRALSQVFESYSSDISRIYACHCHAYMVTGCKPLSTHGPDSWTCGGHPVPLI